MVPPGCALSDQMGLFSVPASSSDCLCDPQTDSERTDTAADGETSATEVRLQTERWGRLLAQVLCG